MQEKLSVPLIVGLLTAAVAVVALVGYFVFRPATPGGDHRPLPPSAQARQALQGGKTP